MRPLSFLAAAVAGHCAAATAALAQCPTDYFVYFNDKPDDLAPGNGVVAGAFDVPAITLFDPDGTGPLAPIFIAAIHYIGPADCANQFTISSEWTRLDRWDTATSTWVPISPRFDGVVSCFELFDEDQGGPNPARLYIGGRFSGWNGINSPNIMRYDGTTFTGVRNGLNNTVWCMRVHDDDGTGPIAPKLYLGGQMSAAHASAAQGQVNCGNLIRLTGGQLWENPPSGFNDSVFAIASFDEDGPGPGVAKLAAGGAFSANGALTHRMISLWDGANWTTLGTGLDPVESWPSPARRVFSLCEFDEDGSGPQLPSLFVGGSFYRTMDGGISPLVVRWRKNHVTGNAGWLSVPSAPGLDTNPSGTLCSNFCSNYPYEPLKPRVLCMMPFDTDGAGAGPTELFIGGDITNGLMKWNPATNTTSWVQGDSGIYFGQAPSAWSNDSYGGKFPLAMLNVAGNASVPERLIIGAGKILQQVPIPIHNPYQQGCPWATINMTTTWVCNPIIAWGAGGNGPGVSNPPDNTWVNIPASASGGFGLVASGSGPFTYRWRKNGIDLINGTSQGLGNVIGATGPVTIIGGTANPITVAAQGWYDCRVSNDCGSGYSPSAWMVVQPDATPYFPIRFDEPAPPVFTTIANAPLGGLLGNAPWPRFFTHVGETPFAIAPTGNNAWRSRFAPGDPNDPKSIYISLAHSGIGEVFTMLNTDGSVPTNVGFTFSTAAGQYYTTTLIAGTHIRSYTAFFGPQTTASADTTNVYDNGLTRLDKQRILLPNEFRNQMLTSLIVTDLGTDGSGRSILAGLTLHQLPPACGGADFGGQGGVPGADGILDNNDFIVFIDRYFAGDPAADVGSQGGIPPGDGVFDNNDFIVFIDMFFAGCP
ncbi:MAG: GC-type dockerin domain-anchored protein [Phycisphaerales bacterium]|nr:GC-type dockerin domain-anchored protein [Phycisphaerales bacterium]